MNISPDVSAIHSSDSWARLGSVSSPVCPSMLLQYLPQQMSRQNILEIHTALQPNQKISTYYELSNRRTLKHQWFQTLVMILSGKCSKIHRSTTNNKTYSPTFLHVPSSWPTDTCLTWEVEKPAVHSAGDRLEFNHIHGLANVHSAGHAR